MGRRRKIDKPYRLIRCKNRPYMVIFDAIPFKRYSSGSYDLAETIEWADSFLANGGLVRPERVPTVKEYGEGFFLRCDEDSLRQRDRLYGHEYSKGRYKKYQHYIDDYINPVFGGYLVTAVTAKAIERWLPTLSDKRTGKSLANDTINKVLVAFRLLMEDVKKDGFRDDNPAKDVRMLAKKGKRRKPIPPSVLRILFPDNLEKRIEIWHGLMWATYFSVLYDTGFRPSECAALRVSDIYQSSRGLSVGTSHTVNREEGEVVERVKTSDDGGYDKRMGLLYDDTAELLIRLIKEDGLKGDDYLFRAPERENGVLLPDSSNKHFKTVLKEQGVFDEGLVQYGLRHSYMTARRGEMPDEILAISMGHTKLRDDYDHRSMTDLIRQLDDRRDSFFESRKHIDDEPEIRKFKP